MCRLKLKKLLICLASTLPMMANAYEPSVTALGMGGVYTSGWVDGLIPLYMNTNQQMLYSDIQFEGNSTNAGILSAGGGYRQQINSQGIAGAYLFYDRERSASENYYNVISPGIEYLTPSWQYRLNYYAPFGTKTHLTSQGWAEDFGNTEFIERTGHDSFDRMQYNYESLSYGADATIGYRFQADKRWQVNLSPYAFNQADSNTMMGANSQLNFYSNDYTTVFLGDGYDNVNHNRVFIGVSLTFGGHNNDDTVENLMQSPVYRNLDVNTTANGLPVNDYTSFGAQEQSADNLWYVNNTPPGSEDGYGSVSDGDGTYENPYTSIYAVTEMPDNADIRVASTGIDYGLIPGYGVGSPEDIILRGTQTMAGYTNDYNTLATGSDRPIIDSYGITLEGDNSLSGLQFLGFGSADSVGVTVNGHASLSDVVIGSSDASTSYQTGVRLTDGATASIVSSSITGYSSNTGSEYGVKAESNNTLTISDSTINAISASTTNSSANTAYPVAVLNNSTASIHNSILNGITTYGRAYGLYLLNAGDVDVTQSTITGSASAGSVRGIAMTNQVGDVNVTDSVITANGLSDVRAVSNIGGSNESSFSITDSILNATSTSANSTATAYGVYSSANAGSIEINNSEINVNSSTGAGGTSPSAMGVYVTGANSGAVTLTNSDITVSVNDGGIGAGVYSNSTGAGVVTVTDSNISVTSGNPIGIGGTITQSNNVINLEPV